jgi:hypothetical protein
MIYVNKRNIPLVVLVGEEEVKPNDYALKKYGFWRVSINYYLML